MTKAFVCDLETALILSLMKLTRCSYEDCKEHFNEILDQYVAYRMGFLK